jgi:hypothetical protein
MCAIVALFLASLLASTPVRGQAEPATETTSASQGAMPDLGKGAEEVAAQLRQLAESLSDSDAFASLEAEVAADAHWAAQRWSETGDLLRGTLRPSALDSLASSWEALRSQLDDLRGRIDARARRRATDLETLASCMSPGPGRSIWRRRRTRPRLSWNAPRVRSPRSTRHALRSNSVTHASWCSRTR